MEAQLAIVKVRGGDLDTLRRHLAQFHGWVMELCGNGRVLVGVAGTPEEVESRIGELRLLFDVEEVRGTGVIAMARGSPQTFSEDGRTVKKTGGNRIGGNRDGVVEKV